MASCDVTATKNNAKCFTCEPDKALQGMTVYLLCRILSLFDPMSDCSPATVKNAAKCFTECMSAKELYGSMVYLLCQIEDAISGGGGSGGINCLLGMWVVPTVAELRMISTQLSSCQPLWARTAGMDAVGDGQDSEYMWDANCTDPDNGLSVVYADDNPFPNPGAWRSYTGVP